MKEKRHFTRFAVDGTAYLVAKDGRRWPAQIEDLSLKGALFTHPEGWCGKVGDRGGLELAVGGGTLIRMQGRIVHINGGHVGFSCESIDIDSISHLKRLIELNLGDDALLHRELGELVEGH